MKGERWLPVVGFEGIYSVSDKGRIRSEPRTAERVVNGRAVTQAVKGRMLSLIRAPGGYQFVHLSGPGRPKRIYYVHALVAAAFIGPRPEGAQVAHWNGDGSDNSVENLRYATRAQNEADKVRHGRTLRGTRHPSSKLSETDVVKIREMVNSGAVTKKDIALQFGVDRRTIGRIARGERWNWLVQGAPAA